MGLTKETQERIRRIVGIREGHYGLGYDLDELLDRVAAAKKEAVRRMPTLDEDGNVGKEEEADYNFFSDVVVLCDDVAHLVGAVTLEVNMRNNIADRLSEMADEFIKYATTARGWSEGPRDPWDWESWWEKA